MSQTSLEHKITFDSLTLDNKILVDNDDILKMPVVIASEIVQQYADGMAYKPAEELERMAKTAQRIGTRPIKILEHPNADTNYLVLKHSDVYGRLDNFQYVKNLNDPKTGRPCRRGVTADASWYKDVTPPDVIEKARKGVMRDVSIGFTYDAEKVPGEFGGVHYDYVQRNIFLDHLAGPIPAGRCPGPICGIGYDSGKVSIDAAVVDSCPVLSHMKSVGFGEACKRLYKVYGPDVIEAIDTGSLPVVEPPRTSVDQDFEKQLAEFNTWQSKSQKD